MKSFVADKNRKLSKLALYHVQDLSFSAFMKALRKKDIKVNGKRVSEDVTLSVGDRVDIYYAEQSVQKFTEIFRDENVLVIYKKSGYTSEGVYQDILSVYPTASFIHRLDRNTDGVMIFGLNQIAESELLYGFKNRTFDKKYHAFVKGVPEKKQAVLTAYLLKDEKQSTVKIFDNPVKGGLAIKTGYKVLENTTETSLLEITLFTGKTHQIRAHLAHIGHPIIGDGKYGDFDFNKKYKAKSQMLTAVSITLNFDTDSPLAYLNGKTFVKES